MNENIRSILVDEDKSIMEVMKIINSAPKMDAPSGLAVIVDGSNTLEGIVTDGDIRRALIEGVDLNSPVKGIMSKNPIKVTMSNITRRNIIKQVNIELKKKKLKNVNIIITDKNNKIEDIITLFELWKEFSITNKSVTIIGLGYVGLTLAVFLADRGFEVYGVDTNREIIAYLNNGKAHFHETGLDQLISKYVNKKIFVSNKISNISDIYIISVGSPINENGSVIIDYLKSASEMVGDVLKKGDLVILRSTVPIGTSMAVVLPILEKRSDLSHKTDDFYLVFAPERTVEGSALRELGELPQVIGGINKDSVDLAANFFREITPTVVGVESLEAAEIVKLIDNTFRDVNFAYANEIALICEKFNIDTVNIIKAANEGYSRNNVCLPSPGVGGPCLTKDPYILVQSARGKGYNPHLILQSRKINEIMPNHVAEKIRDFCKKYNKNTEEAKIFLVGFAFKGWPETSDIRNSVTLDVLNILRGEYNFKNFLGYDSVVSRDDIKKQNVEFVNVDDGFKRADCVIIMNNHPFYERWDIVKYLELMNRPALFLDCWHIFPPDKIKNLPGVVYSGLGMEYD